MILKKRIRKYLLYAIGEILLVMIGILLALQVNNKNEAHKIKLEEQNTLREIKKDLKMEQFQFRQLIEANRGDFNYFEKIENRDFKNADLDSLILRLNMYLAFEPRNAGYIGLKSSNNTKLIKNDKLRGGIVFYYESAHNTLRSNTDWQENFVLNYIEKYIMDNNVPINDEFIITDRSFIEEELNKSQLNTLITYRKSTSKYLISMLENTVNYNDVLINKIDKELESY